MSRNNSLGRPNIVSIQTLIDAKKSMLGNSIPVNYGTIETTEEAIAAAIPKPSARIIRIHIIWDNPMSNLHLDRILEDMRSTGAAMVTQVEEVSP